MPDDMFYTSFTRDIVEPTYNWLWQFTWFWNHCLSHYCRITDSGTLRLSTH